MISKEDILSLGYNTILPIIRFMDKTEILVPDAAVRTDFLILFIHYRQDFTSDGGVDMCFSKTLSSFLRQLRNQGASFLSWRGI
jgi:hypothetical protein